MAFSRTDRHKRTHNNFAIEMIESRLLLALVTPGVPAAASINPIADAYVQDGGSSDLNYGTATTLYAKTYGIGSNRRAFFRFDLSTLGNNLSSVSLNLYATYSGIAGTSTAIQALPVSDALWTETDLTWNNQPTVGYPALASTTINGGSWAWYTLDMTGYATSLKNSGQNWMSFAVVSPVSTQAIVGLSPRENSSARPRLDVSVGGPSASAVSPTRIDVKWVDTNTTESGYTVQRSIDGINFSTLGNTAANASTYSDTTALEGRLYYYRVRAFDATTTSAYLSGASARSLSASPTALSLQSLASGATTISWLDNSTGETGYAIERGVSTSAFKPIAVISANAKSHVDSAGLEGTGYYRVRAFNSAGFSAYSNTLSVTGNFPSAPINIAASFPASKSTRLSWTDTSAIETRYMVQRSIDQIYWVTLNQNLPANTTAYTDNDSPVPYQRYYYRVRAASSAGAGAWSTPKLVERLETIRQSMMSDIYSLDYTLATGSSYETRALTQRAWYTLVLGEDPASVAKVEDYLSLMWSVQEMSTSSAYYGRVPWQDNSWVDGNAIEFTMSNFAAMYVGHLGRLDPAYLDSSVAGYTVRQHIQAAISAVKNHTSVSVDYTNIYLMRAANAVLLGEIVGDSAAVATGYAYLGNWLSDTKAAGINEYNSPGYGALDISTIQRLYTHVRSPAVRARAQAVLDELYADACANYFSPRGELAGAHSRDYDFLNGIDSINAWYFMQGMTNTLQGDGTDLYCSVIEGTYQPAASTIALSSPGTRIVKQKWGTGSGQDKYTYLTPDFAIGSTSAFYSTHDKQISASLKSSKSMPQLSVVEDSFDSPYGNVTVIDAAGKPKVYHLKDSISAVQDKGTILAVANIGPEFVSVPGNTYTTIGSNFVFPSNADKLYLNGVEITDRTATINTSLNAVLGVREGNSVIAFRIFLADGLKGYIPTFAIKFDAPAGENAARLVAYHYNGATTTMTGDCRIGYLMTAQKCTTDAEVTAFLLSVKNAAIALAVSGNKTKATLTLATTTLISELDVSTELSTSRRVNASAYVADRFSLNNLVTTHNLAAEILDSLYLSPMFVEGKVFADDNANGQLDDGEFPLPYTPVYFDTNNNTLLDAGELSTRTDASGDYSFAARLAGTTGTQNLRVQIESGSITVPTGGSYSVNLSAGTGYSGLDFGVGPVVSSPRALLRVWVLQSPTAFIPLSPRLQSASIASAGDDLDDPTSYSTDNRKRINIRSDFIEVGRQQRYRPAQ